MNKMFRPLTKKMDKLQKEAKKHNRKAAEALAAMVKKAGMGNGHTSEELVKAILDGELKEALGHGWTKNI